MKAYDHPPEFKKSVLGNGVRLVTEHHTHSRAVSVGFFMDTGSRDEALPLSGASHFIEHMVFKGTKTRSAYDIAKCLEAVGGELNAYTTKEGTCFHATALREHTSICLDVLSDIVSQASFCMDEFEKERNVILQEILMCEEQLEEHIFDLYFENAFKGQSMGQPILGTPDSLDGMSLKHLKKFYQSNYCASNLVVSVAGHVDHEEVAEQLEKTFHIPKRRDVKPKRKKTKYKQFTEVVSKPSEQIHLVLGGPSSSYVAKDRFEALVTSSYLGGGMTSRLYQKVREEKGLAYNIYSYLSSYTDAGLLMVYAGTSQKNLPRVLKLIQSEFGKLEKKGISKNLLNFYKTQVKGQILLSSDDIENRMTSLGINELVFGRYRPVEKVVEDIDKVTVDSVKSYIKKHIDSEKMSLMIIGDFSDTAELKI